MVHAPGDRRYVDPEKLQRDLVQIDADLKPTVELLEKPIITFNVEFNTPTIPIPAGPISIAANFDLAIEIKTPNI